MTSGSAVHNSYQLRADIALTDPERLNKASQLSRGSFAASVWDVFKRFRISNRNAEVASEASSERSELFALSLLGNFGILLANRRFTTGGLLRCS